MSQLEIEREHRMEPLFAGHVSLLVALFHDRHAQETQEMTLYCWRGIAKEETVENEAERESI
jgi:hypothetical protein